MSSIIVVTYKGPTDTKPARLRVTCGAFKPKTYTYPHQYDGIRAYELVARMYLDDMGWAKNNPIYGGWIKGSIAGFVAVPI